LARCFKKPTIKNTINEMMIIAAENVCQYELVAPEAIKAPPTRRAHGSTIATKKQNAQNALSLLFIVISTTEQFPSPPSSDDRTTYKPSAERKKRHLLFDHLSRRQ
jgi:hypothetical protein